MNTKLRVVWPFLGLALLLAQLFIGVTPANAATISPGGLGECNTPQDRGGWASRSFVVPGTNSTDDDTPVRPRNLRLAEPCVDGDFYQVPLELAEVVMGADPYDDLWNEPSSGKVLDCIQTQYQTVTVTWLQTAPETCNGMFQLYRGTSASPIVSRKVLVGGCVFNNTFLNQATCDYAVQPGASTSGQFINFNVLKLCRVIATGVFELIPQTVFNVILSSSENPTGDNVSVSCNTGREIIAFYGYSGVLSASDSLNVGGVFARRDGVSVPGDPGTILGYQSSYARIGADASPAGTSAGYFECSSTRTGSLFQVPIENTYVSQEADQDSASSWGVPKVVDPGPPEVVSWTRHENMDFDVDIAACPFVSRIELDVCIWITFGPHAYSCTTTSWSFDVWTTHPVYNEPTTPYQDICEHATGGGLNTICDPILFPEYKNMAEYDNACPNPPAPVWLDFSWLPAFVGYHVRCLFIPQGGPDSTGEFARALDASVFGELTEAVESAAVGFNYSSDCGVLVDSTAAQVPFRLDTCDLDSMSGAKPFIAAGLWIGFGGWAIWFFIQTVVGISNRHTPNPLEDKE